MKGAIAGACLFEDWAKTLDEAERWREAAGSTSILCTITGPADDVRGHHPSMMVNVIRNETAGIETYCNLYEGSARSYARANTPDVLDRLR